jgi:SNF2 family DNA or RNA helicase
MSKTYGILELVINKWQMSNIPPHVAIRLKQLFPRIPKLQTGVFTFPNDNNHCADLSWFIQRYPMEMKNDDRAELSGGKSLFEVNQVRMEEILRPDYCPPSRAGLREGQVIRLYQAQAIDVCLARGSLLLGDDIGLGKTYTANGMLLDPRTLPAAVVVQTHLQAQWQEKIEQFTTLRVHKIKGTRPYDLPAADIYLYKYSQLMGWIDTFEDGFFKAVVFDEVQELRTGMSSGKGAAAKRLTETVQYRLGLSATPIYNYGSEIWNIMQCIDPSVLGTREEFIREWCIDDRQVRDPDALGTFLREQNVMIRRTKREVGQQMPPLNIIIEHVDSDESALKSIEELARQLAFKTTVGSFMERGRAGMELDLLMRQATGIAKAASVAQYAKLFLEAGMPIMLGGWHRAVYAIWLKELAQYNPVMYTGSESESQKTESVRRFIEGESNLFIMSLRSGAGLDGLQFRCSTVLIGELDWSPKVIEQFVGRVDREGQEEQVSVIYLNIDEGSDPPMVEMLGIKSSQSSGIVDPGRQFEAKHSNKSRIQALAEQFLNKTVKTEIVAEEDSNLLQATLF